MEHRVKWLRLRATARYFNFVLACMSFHVVDRQRMSVSTKENTKLAKKHAILVLGVSNFGKCWPIFKILSVLDSARKFEIKAFVSFPPHLNMLLHYRVKCKKNPK